jgi:hypothetical protein
MYLSISVAFYKKKTRLTFKEDNLGSVASKDGNWAGKYVFDLRSLATQQRLNDPQHNLADFSYTRIRVLITYKLADLFTQ